MRVLASLLTDQGQAGDALPYLERALAIEPGSGATLAVMSLTYARLGRGSDAIAAAERPTQPGTDTAQIILLKGDAMLVIDRPDLAENYFARLVALQPDSPEALAKLGTSKVRLGKKDEAQGSCSAVPWRSTRTTRAPEPDWLESMVCRHTARPTAAISRFLFHINHVSRSAVCAMPPCSA